MSNSVKGGIESETRNVTHPVVLIPAAIFAPACEASTADLNCTHDAVCSSNTKASWC